MHSAPPWLLYIKSVWQHVTGPSLTFSTLWSLIRFLLFQLIKGSTKSTQNPEKIVILPPLSRDPLQQWHLSETGSTLYCGPFHKLRATGPKLQGRSTRTAGRWKCPSEAHTSVVAFLQSASVECHAELDALIGHIGREPCSIHRVAHSLYHVHKRPKWPGQKTDLTDNWSWNLFLAVCCLQNKVHTSSSHSTLWLCKNFYFICNALFRFSKWQIHSSYML